MPNLTPAEHMRRLQELEKQAANFRNVWQELQSYVAPWRDPITNATSVGSKQTDRIFDSTASHASNIAASAVHGMTMPAGTKWFNLVHPDPLFREDVVINQWLEESVLRMDAAFNASNLAQESQELIHDLLVFGTACLYMEMKPASAANPFPGFRFRAMPPGSYVAAENDEGIVDTIYRKFRLSASAIWQKWGKKSGDEVLKAIEDKKFDTRFHIVHAVGPRDPRGVTPGNDLRIPKSRRPFGGIWMVGGESSAQTMGHSSSPVGSTKDPHVLAEDGLFEFPFLVPRWRKMSGETYGRCPGIDALPDVRTLNQAVELRLKAWQLAIAPPMATSDRGVLGDVRLSPFGRTHTRGNPRDAIMPIDIGANFNVANFQEDQLRAQIQKAFFIDQIGRAESQGLSPKSATEVSISFEMMLRILGPVASRLTVEFLSPLIQNSFRMMLRMGGIEQPPDEAIADSGMINANYQGPLARAQSIQEVDAINRYMQVTLPLAELRPEVLNSIDFAKLGRSMAFAISVPADVMKSAEQEQAESEAQQAAAQAQTEQADLLQGAEVLNKVAPAAIAGQNAGVI